MTNKRDSVFVAGFLLVALSVLWRNRPPVEEQGYLITCESQAQSILSDKENWRRFLSVYFPKGYPVAGKGKTVRPDGRIFVSVASYRDSELIPTITSLLENSHRPERLVVCVCLQDDADGLRTLPVELERLRDQHMCSLKCLRYHYKEAKGPTWARYLIQCEWSGEEYYLQIDSHMRFAKDWDRRLIRCLSLTPKTHGVRKTCVTNYVSLYNHRTNVLDSRFRGPLRLLRFDDKDGLPRFNSKFVSALPNRPLRSYCWSACFSFSSSHIILDAPYDPYTPYLFFGEEVDIGARLFARGWSFYAPMTNICFTTFVRSYRPLFWYDHPYQKIVERISRLRLYYRLGLLQETTASDIPDELLIEIGPFSIERTTYPRYSSILQKYRYTNSTTQK